MSACYNGPKDVVKLLLDHSERIDLNTRDDNGRTALMLSCFYGHKNTAKLLLNYYDRRIAVNTRDNDGNTALRVTFFLGYSKVWNGKNCDFHHFW